MGLLGIGNNPMVGQALLAPLTLLLRLISKRLNLIYLREILRLGCLFFIHLVQFFLIRYK